MKFLLILFTLMEFSDIICFEGSEWVFPDEVSQHYTTSSSKGIDITTKRNVESANTPRISALSNVLVSINLVSLIYKINVKYTECEEYTTNLTDIIYYGGLSLQSTTLQIKRTKCTGQDTGLIVGGEKAKAREFVHMAALGWDNAEQLNETEKKKKPYLFLCGGNLISERQ